MNISTEHRQLIQDYYDGVLTAQQELLLQELIKDHPEVAETFNAMGTAIDGIKTYGFRQMLEGLQRKHFPDDAAASERGRALKENLESPDPH